MGANQGNGSALFTIRRRHPDTNFEKCSTFVKWLILVDILNSLIKGGSGRWGDIYAVILFMICTSCSNLTAVLKIIFGLHHFPLFYYGLFFFEFQVQTSYSRPRYVKFKWATTTHNPCFPYFDIFLVPKTKQMFWLFLAEKSQKKRKLWQRQMYKWLLFRAPLFRVLTQILFSHNLFPLLNFF